jgi:predicted component of type VI protein secretion system
MPLTIKIVSEHRDLVGDDCVREYHEQGGTIGRSLQNDWILPDPDRYISGRHATIDYKGGMYYLADTSSNGVYMNGEDEPIGKGNPRRLFDGDRLRMGDFEFVVSLDEGLGLEMPPPEPMTVVPDHIEQLVQEDQIKSGIQLLDEEELTGDEAFQSALFGDAARKEKAPEQKKKIDNQANPFAPAPTKAQQAAMQAAELLDAFMTGLDISRAEIHPSTDPLEVMENAGKVLKEFVDGATDLLASRTALKSMFRLDQTTVMPRHNNPLKLAENTRDSMMQLLVGREGEYLSPVDAVREVCRDLKFHHDAVLEAMISAFVEFADKFDPDELQQNFDRTLNKKPLIKALNQMKYWQLYCDLYPIMTQATSGKFPHQFSEEFVRSYEKHIAEYKRLERRGEIVPKKRGENEPAVQHGSAYDGEELVDQTEEASYADQF